MKRFFYLLGAAALTAALAACATAPSVPGLSSIPPGDDTKVIPADFRIIGYFPSWTKGDPDSLDYHRLTHINWSFVDPRADGTVSPMPAPEVLAKLVTLAHSHQVKVLVSIGGWMEDSPNPQAFAAVGDNKAIADTFAGNVLAMVRQYNLDGIDIDWETPNGGTARHFERLMTALAKVLHPEGKLLSAAVGSDNPSITDKALKAVDFINVMAYDSGWGPNSSSGPHSSRNFAADAADYWKTDRQLPGDKVNLGVPFYGRADASWKTDKTYKDIVAADPSAPGYDDSQGFNYNGLATIQWKTQWAREHIGGIMIWELTQDSGETSSLLNAVYSQVAVPAPVPVP